MVIKVAAGKQPDIRLPPVQPFVCVQAVFKIANKLKKAFLRQMPEVDINKAEVAARALGIGIPGLF